MTNKNSSEKKSPVLRPRDAATLVILRNDGDEPRFLMGKRHERHKFMPGKFVFPGGRVDVGDGRIKPATELNPLVEQSLLNKMKGRPSPQRARALAMAAVRETFEEVGLIVGKPQEGTLSSKASGWCDFLGSGYQPVLDSMTLLARAITPPGRPRRFDTRFFVVDASTVANLDEPVNAANDELLEANWVGFERAKQLDLPHITHQILDILKQRIKKDDVFEPGHPVPFQYTRGKSWVYDKV